MKYILLPFLQGPYFMHNANRNTRCKAEMTTRINIFFQDNISKTEKQILAGVLLEAKASNVHNDFECRS